MSYLASRVVYLLSVLFCWFKVFFFSIVYPLPKRGIRPHTPAGQSSHEKKNPSLNSNIPAATQSKSCKWHNGKVKIRIQSLHNLTIRLFRLFPKTLVALYSYRDKNNSINMVSHLSSNLLPIHKLAWFNSQSWDHCSSLVYINWKVQPRLHLWYCGKRWHDHLILWNLRLLLSPSLPSPMKMSNN